MHRDAGSRHGRRQPDRRGVAHVLRQIAAHERAEEEAHPERDADQGEGFGAVLGGGLVGDVGLRQGEVAGGQAVDHPGREDHPQGPGVGHEREAQQRANLADEQHRLAAGAVGDAPEQRARHELAGGVHRDQQRGLERGGAETLGIGGQQREHERQPEDVDQDDQEDRKQGRARAAGGIHRAPVA